MAPTRRRGELARETAGSDRASLPDRGRMVEMRCEFFVFADGPWRGRIIDNPFEADGLLPASSLLIAGGPLRYVLTAARRTFPDGGTGAIYRVDRGAAPGDLV